MSNAVAIAAVESHTKAVGPDKPKTTELIVEVKTTASVEDAKSVEGEGNNKHSTASAKAVAMEENSTINELEGKAATFAEVQTSFKACSVGGIAKTTGLVLIPETPTLEVEPGEKNEARQTETSSSAIESDEMAKPTEEGVMDSNDIDDDDASVDDGETSESDDGIRFNTSSGRCDSDSDEDLKKQRRAKIQQRRGTRFVPRLNFSDDDDTDDDSGSSREPGSKNVEEQSSPPPINVSEPFKPHRDSENSKTFGDEGFRENKSCLESETICLNEKCHVLKEGSDRSKPEIPSRSTENDSFSKERVTRSVRSNSLPVSAKHTDLAFISGRADNCSGMDYDI